MARSVQNCRRAQRYVQAFCALVRTHFSLSSDSVGSSGMGWITGFPIRNGVLRNNGMSGTGWLLTLTYSSAQSMMAKTSIAALFHPSSEKAHGLNFRLMFFRKYLIGPFLNVQGRILHYLLYPFFMLFPGQQLCT